MNSEAHQSPIVLAAQEAYETMSAVCHAMTGQGIEAPVVSETLGHLRGASGYMLIQVLQQLSEGLQRSLPHTQADTDHHDGSDASRAVLHTQRLLDQAAGLASDLSDLLAGAQMALKTPSLDQPPEHADEA